MRAGRVRVALGLSIAGCWIGPIARADIGFRYSRRTKNYSAWTPAGRGDTNTVGMSGATIAISSSISAAEANPAGFAMETGSVSAQINRSTIEDPEVQRSGDEQRTSQWGLAVSPPPWGFSLAYYSPITETGTFTSPNTGQRLQSEIDFREYRLTVAHALMNERLSIGLSLEMLQAIRELGGNSYNATGWSYVAGALYRLPEHVVLGATYIPGASVGPASGAADSVDMPGFNQAVIRPTQVGFGLGWLPNRFFKAGASLTYVGATENTGLLADQSITDGANPTWVPRVGASYVLADFQNFKSELAMGSYYEQSRISDQPSRLHATMGLDANPYFVNLGAGFDLSSNFKNVMLSVGIDVVRTLRTFDIIPKDPVPPANRFFPPPTRVVADGLPEPLVHGEHQRFQGPSVGDVTKIIQETPKNVEKKLSGKPTSVEVERAKKDQPAP